jgi:putative ABC transport system substrate-binding protein
MRRRDFIALATGAVAWPGAARAQPAILSIGWLHGADAKSFSGELAAFRQGLKEGGYEEGRNLKIEYRWADGRFDQLSPMAKELIGRNVSVLAAVGGNDSNLAAKAATNKIPIVFSSAADPVRLGLIRSMSRPEGNITGVYFPSTDILPKALGILHATVPIAKTVALLVNPQSREAARQKADVQEAAQKLGLEIEVFSAGSAAEVDDVFANISPAFGALIVGGDPSLASRIDHVIAGAAIRRIPTIYSRKEFASGGGLMSYGTNFKEGYRQVGDYIARILNGAKPSDLPVVQSAKYEFVINLKTAKKLGLEVHPQVLGTADEVIE